MRIVTEVIHLKKLEKLNPEDNCEPQQLFLKIFDQMNTTLDDTGREKLDATLMDKHDILGRYCFCFQIHINSNSS